MRAVSRLFIAVASAGLALGAPALAQEAATTNTPASDAIGPRELQGFSLSGTVTRPADQPAPERRAPPAERPATAQRAPSEQPPAATRQAATPSSATRSAKPRNEAPAPVPAPAREFGAPSQTARDSSVTVALPPAAEASAVTPSATSSPGFAPEPEAAPALPEHGLPIWPWLLAALALGAGGGYFFWRNRHREAFAGGPDIAPFVAPRGPAPPPQPVQRPAAPAPASTGIVSTRLRPWMDIGFQPLRCIVEEGQVRFDFEVELFNSGSAAARDVLIEARMINASAEQDRELRDFFANPVAKGERIQTIAPLKRVRLQPRLVMPLSQLRVLEAGGRNFFVPLIAFNALYSWGGGAGQTSAAYLVGRDTKGEKLGPFRLDLGPRVFRGVDARLLPAAVRD